MIKEVYIIWYQYYSDESIDSIFDNEEEAYEYLEINNNKFNDCTPYRLESFYMVSKKKGK